METTFPPVSKRSLAELQGYVAWSTSAFRIGGFLAVVAVTAWISHAVSARIGHPVFRLPLWWIVPSVVEGVLLYRVAGRATRGPKFRAAVRADIARGVAAAHRVVVVDAIEVEEQEDEGPAYFVLTADGKTMVFAGQYLEGYKRKGFPWKAFEIL